MSACPKCGADVSEGAAACGACGAALSSGAGGSTVPGAPVFAAPIAGEAAGAVAFSAASRAALLATRVEEGTLVDQKYSIQRVLGEGGMGVVYLAQDIHTRTPVVLKAVRADLAHRKDVRDRTLAEGRALAQIDHPNVVHLNAVVVEGDSLWLVMQYIDGESLEQRIQRYIDDKRPMPVDDVLRIFRQIVEGVAAVHHEGMIHRDLKPGNVLIRKKDSVAKVTDFGIAKIEDEARAGKGMTKGIIGSLWYMSPEQVTGRRDLDKRVDVYALGILLYEMLVGRVPFDDDSDREIMRMHIQAPIPRIAQMRRDVPEAIDAIIQKACAKDRADRFQDAGEIIAALDALAQPGPRTSVAVQARESTADERAAAATTRAASPVIKTAADGDLSPATTAESPPDKPSKPRRTWAIVGTVLIAIAGGAGALVALGVIPMAVIKKTISSARSDATPTKSSSPIAPTSGSGAPAEPPPPVSAAASAITSAKPAETSAPDTKASPLAALVGQWVGNGRELEAVLSGDELEFRVLNPAQFDPQGYERGEARFALLAMPGETRVFAVEDRVRPIPPSGKKYDAQRSRSTCREIWTSAGEQPLRATFDGSRLTVEFVKIEPKDANFIIEKGEITSCIGLRKLTTAKVVSTLSRP